MYFYAHDGNLRFFAISLQTKIRTKITFARRSKFPVFRKCAFPNIPSCKKLILKVVNSVVSNSYFLLWSYMKYVKKCIIYRSEMRI